MSPITTSSFAPAASVAAPADPRLAAGQALLDAAEAIPEGLMDRVRWARNFGETDSTPSLLLQDVNPGVVDAGIGAAIAGARAAATDLDQTALTQARAGVAAWLASAAQDTHTIVSLSAGSQDLRTLMQGYLAAGGETLIQAAQRLGAS